jgi:hypothetical protein
MSEKQAKAKRREVITVEQITITMTNGEIYELKPAAVMIIDRETKQPLFDYKEIFDQE